jgi:hypothetical protein
MDNKKFEKLIDLIINENEEQARELFHEIVVEKSREIYESIMDEEMMGDMDEGMGGQVGDLLDEINAEESGEMSEAEDMDMEIDDMSMDDGEMDDEVVSMDAGDMDDDDNEEILLIKEKQQIPFEEKASMVKLKLEESKKELQTGEDRKSISGRAYLAALGENAAIQFDSSFKPLFSVDEVYYRMDIHDFDWNTGVSFSFIKVYLIVSSFAAFKNRIIAFCGNITRNDCD